MFPQSIFFSFRRVSWRQNYVKVNVCWRLQNVIYYCKILRISWIQHMTNVEILRRLHKDRELLSTLENLGHMLRGPKYRLLQTIMQGKVEGKRRLGRKNPSWLRNIWNWTGLTVKELSAWPSIVKDSRSSSDRSLRLVGEHSTQRRICFEFLAL